MALFWFFCYFYIFLFLTSTTSQREDSGEQSTDDLPLLLKLLDNRENNSSGHIADRIRDILKESQSEEEKAVDSRISIECELEEFRCLNGHTCVHSEWECDGVVDCSDESDEDNCFECTQGPHPRLLPTDKVCDDVADCSDGEDERGCKSPCQYYEFRCDEFDPKSQCVLKDWTCDGTPDCKNLGDESIQLCGELSDRCKPDDFVCGHELFCVSPAWKCDNADDCGDNSDEESCLETKSDLDGIVSSIFDTGDWGEWSDWSACSSQCDGEQLRTRRCNSGYCSGRSNELRPCGKGYPCMKEPTSGCGTRSFDLPFGKILGGIDAQPHEWPWQIQIFRPGRTIPFCGGSLIRRNWILTAAHCFDKKRYPAEKYSIALGRQHTSKRIRDAEAIFVHAKSLIIHEAYKTWSHRDDIALMELEGNVLSTAGINVICLPNNKYDWFKHDPGQEPDCFVTGFGINEIGKRPLVLQEAHVRLIDHDTCSKTHVYGSRVTKSMLCAGHLEGGIDACQGDSGGPLVCQNPTDGRWYQVGLTSWGKGCGLPNRPGVYTKISKYMHWIESKIGNR